MADSMIALAEAALVLELHNQADDGRCSVAGDAIELNAEDLVRAVLKAMREPTEAMVDAAYSQSEGFARSSWQQMIDAALENGA